MRWLLPLLLLLPGCYATTAAGAAAVTAEAAAVSAANRSAGMCIATCTNGTTCNPRTGLCEKSACPGGCGATEHCEHTGTVAQCVAGPEPTTSDVVTRAPGSPPIVPAVDPVPFPSGPPIIVPAAEKHPPNDKDK
jgi:hypothetical protein